MRLTNCKTNSTLDGTLCIKGFKRSEGAKTKPLRIEQAEIINNGNSITIINPETGEQVINIDKGTTIKQEFTGFDIACFTIICDESTRYQDYERVYMTALFDDEKVNSQFLEMLTALSCNRKIA